MPLLNVDFHDPDRNEHPLDVVERLASLRDWIFDRAETDEMSVTSPGRWTDYNVAFTWIEDVEALHVACAFDLKVQERQRTEVMRLIAMINEQLWVGHFDLWTTDNVVMFRHALLLTGRGADPPAMRHHDEDRGGRLRTLLPGVPVRALGRQERPRSAGRCPVRDRRRGVTGPMPMPASLVLAGAGKMGGAMLAGWLDAGLDPRRTTIIDPVPSGAIVDLCIERGIALNRPPSPAPFWSSASSRRVWRRPPRGSTG